MEQFMCHHSKISQKITKKLTSLEINLSFKIPRVIITSLDPFKKLTLVSPSIDSYSNRSSCKIQP